MSKRDRTDQHQLELERQFQDNVARVAEQLRDRNVTLLGDETPEDLVTIMEYVERFELAVQNRGGDLMVDEPPRGSDAQPDDPHFVVPVRVRGEPVADYLTRIAEATTRVQEHLPRGSTSPGSAADADLVTGGEERAVGYQRRASPDEPPSERA